MILGEDRLFDPDVDRRRSKPRLPLREDALRPVDRNRNERCAGHERQPRSPSSRGFDAPRLDTTSLWEHADRTDLELVESRAHGADDGTVPGCGNRTPEPDEPIEELRSSQQLVNGQIPHVVVGGERDEHRIDEREMIGRQHGRSMLGNPVPPRDLQIAPEAEKGVNRKPRHRVQEGNDRGDIVRVATHRHPAPRSANRAAKARRGR